MNRPDKSLRKQTRKQFFELTFRNAMSTVAESIGLHHLPVHPDAKDIHEFLTDDAVHGDLIRQAVRTIYKANACSHLDAAVYQDVTLAALGKLRGTLLRARSTDIDQLEFFDRFSSQIANLFDKYSIVEHNRSEMYHHASTLTPSTRYWDTELASVSAKE